MRFFVKTIFFALAALLAISLLSCKKSNVYAALPANKNKVGDIIEKQIQAEQNANGNLFTKNESDDGEQSFANDFSSDDAASKSDGNLAADGAIFASNISDTYGEEFEISFPQRSDVDLDLSKMSGDMIYALVFQFMIEPENYEGKTIRMRGTYDSFYNDALQKNADCCIITDALACCAQGLEFELANEADKNATQLVPGHEITIRGIFKLFAVNIDGVDYDMAKIANAVLE